jgi:hypothetical protein
MVRKIDAVDPENDTKSRNTFCGKNSELLDFITGGTYSYHLDLKGSLGLMPNAQGNVAVWNCEDVFSSANVRNIHNLNIIRSCPFFP